MKKQLYYDDPLIAAYMAREFSVNLVYEEDVDRLPKTWHKTYGVNGFYTRSHHDIITSSLEVGNSRRQEIINKKFFVHPDSFGIFKPQLGDIGRSTSGVLYEYNYGWSTQCGKWSTQCGKELDFLGERDFEIKIIQRDGKPFFMPNIT